MQNLNIFLYIIICSSFVLIYIGIHSYIVITSEFQEKRKSVTLEEICMDNNVQLSRKTLQECYNLLEQRVDSMENNTNAK